MVVKEVLADAQKSKHYNFNVERHLADPKTYATWCDAINLQVLIPIQKSSMGKYNPGDFLTVVDGRFPMRFKDNKGNVFTARLNNMRLPQIDTFITQNVYYKTYTRGDGSFFPKVLETVFLDADTVQQGIFLQEMSSKDRNCMVHLEDYLKRHDYSLVCSQNPKNKGDVGICFPTSKFSRIKTKWTNIDVADGSCRPVCVAVLQNTANEKYELWVCVHNGHGRRNMDELNTTLRNLLFPYKSMYRYTRIVVAGDFNNPEPSLCSIFGLQMYRHGTGQPTYIGGPPYESDWVFSTDKGRDTKCLPQTPSDHLGVKTIVYS